jgi:hypothetical protein
MTVLETVIDVTFFCFLVSYARARRSNCPYVTVSRALQVDEEVNKPLGRMMASANLQVLLSPSVPKRGASAHAAVRPPAENRQCSPRRVAQDRQRGHGALNFRQGDCNALRGRDR